MKRGIRLQPLRPRRGSSAFAGCPARVSDPSAYSSSAGVREHPVESLLPRVARGADDCCRSHWRIMQKVRELCEGGSLTVRSCRGNRLLRCARGGAGTRPERKLRAFERLLAPTRARARLEGQGGDPRAPRPADAVGDHELRTTERDPPEDVRPRAERRDAAGSPGASSSRGTAGSAPTAGRARTASRSTTSCRDRAAERPSGRTSSPRARRATTARATDCWRRRA